MYIQHENIALLQVRKTIVYPVTSGESRNFLKAGQLEKIGKMTSSHRYFRQLQPVQ